MVAGTRLRVVPSEDWVGPWERIFTGTISGMGAPEELTDDRARPGELAYWGPGVTTHEAWGLGSYCYFNVNPSVTSYHAFEVPTVAGVKLHYISTVSLGGVGNITHIVNDTGPVTPANTVPGTLSSFN